MSTRAGGLPSVQGRLSAWVDESESDASRDPDTYLLCATTVDIEAQEGVRAAMRGLLLNARKLHWRDESFKRRRLIVETIADLDVAHVEVVREGVPGERPGRRRRHCMEQLLFALQAQGVEHVTFEGRDQAQNRRDVGMLNALFGRKVITPPLHVRHVAGRTEPLLWVSDALCGALIAERIGDSAHAAVINRRLTRIVV